MKALTTVLAALWFALSSLHLARARGDRAMVLWLPKVLAGSLSPYLALASALTGVVGWRAKAPLAGLLAGLATFLYSRYVWRIAQSPNDFAKAFGPDWRQRISSEQTARMLPSRLAVPLTGLDRLSLGRREQPRVERDLPFWTIPGTTRQLLCDVWQSPSGVRPSGLAFVYFHGSAWHLLDKDYGTRPFFGHLAAQGHVVMDVAYRLCPETDLFGMVGDVKRAVAWMKRHSEHYGVRPERIVLGGGSAGGHLALLAAYAPQERRFVPDDLSGDDTSVRAVVAYYGPCDLRATREHLLRRQPQPVRRKDVRAELPPGPAAKANPAPIRSFEQIGAAMAGLSVDDMMGNLVGGSPTEVPEMYDLASPLTHVGPHCPPTLLFQGEHDSLVPVESDRLLYRKLQEAGVPVVYVELPDTEHAFDVFLPMGAPATRATSYDLERFLALV